MSLINAAAVTVFECRVTCFAEGNFGSAVELGPCPPNSYRITQRFEVRSVTATGSRVVRNLAIPRGFLLQFQRAYLLGRVAGNAPFTEASVGSGRYVLDLVWVHEETLDWLRKTFRGVTVGGDRELAGTAEGPMEDAQVFLAESLTVSSGKNGPPSALSA